MRRIARLLAILSTFGAVVDAEPTAGPLRVMSVIPPGPYYVGQAIEIKVEVDGAPGQPMVEAPRLTTASIRKLPADATHPTKARFLIIPERPGPLDIPPFRGRSGDRSGASKSARLTVANVPGDGRTPAFLGGVGSFQVRAEAEPSRLRPGQTLEYRLRVSGPAAWGSVRAPDLSEWTSLTPQFRVEPLSNVLDEGDPPTRAFRYRLRPTKAGKIVLPPVSVAAFDPKTGHYATRATSGVSIQVEEPPRFDPTRLDYGPIGMADGDRRPGWIAIVLGLGLAGLAVVGSWIYSRRNRRAARAEPVRLALELGRGLAAEDDEVEAARAVAEALTTFLERVDGRSPGVLTPPEALEGFGRVTGDRDLARLAEELVRRCDRARFGRRRGDAMGLIDEGRGLFEGIAGMMGKKKRGGEGGPREAVETAGE